MVGVIVVGAVPAMTVSFSAGVRAVPEKPSLPAATLAS